MLNVVSIQPQFFASRLLAIYCCEMVNVEQNTTWYLATGNFQLLNSQQHNEVVSESVFYTCTTFLHNLDMGLRDVAISTCHYGLMLLYVILSYNAYPPYRVERWYLNLYQ